MDVFGGARSKLGYVLDLLEDMKYYHQTNTHSCNCDICVKKQSLIQSTISRILEEVTLVFHTLGSGQVRQNEFVSPNNFASEMMNFSGVSSTLSGNQESKPAQFEQPSQDSGRFDATSCDSGAVQNTELGLKRNDPCWMIDQIQNAGRVQALVLNSTLRDSGVHSSVTSDSLTPLPGAGSEEVKKSSASHNQFSQCSSSRIGYSEASIQQPRDSNCSSFSYEFLNSHRPQFYCDRPRKSDYRPPKPLLTDAGTQDWHKPFCDTATASALQQSLAEQNSHWQENPYRETWGQDQQVVPPHHSWIPNMFLTFPVMSVLPTANSGPEIETCCKHSNEIFGKFYGADSGRNTSLSDHSGVSLKTSAAFSPLGASFTSKGENQLLETYGQNTDAQQLCFTVDKLYQPPSKSDEVSPAIAVKIIDKQVNKVTSQGDLLVQCDEEMCLSSTVSSDNEINTYSTVISDHVSGLPMKSANAGALSHSHISLTNDEPNGDPLLLGALRRKLVELNLKDCDSHLESEADNEQSPHVNADTMCHSSQRCDDNPTEMVGNLINPESALSQSQETHTSGDSHQTQIDSEVDKNLHKITVNRNTTTETLWHPWEVKDDVLGLVQLPCDDENEAVQNDPNQESVMWKPSSEINKEPSDVSVRPVQFSSSNAAENISLTGKPKKSDLVNREPGQEILVEVFTTGEILTAENISLEEVRKMKQEKAPANTDSSGEYENSCHQSSNNCLGNPRKLSTCCSDMSEVSHKGKARLQGGGIMSQSVVELPVTSNQRKAKLSVGKLEKEAKKCGECLPASIDSTLKCLSNVEQSPRKGRRSDLFARFPIIGSPKLASGSILYEDKENENIQELALMSPTTKLTYHQFQETGKLSKRCAPPQPLSSKAENAASNKGALETSEQPSGGNPAQDNVGMVLNQHLTDTSASTGKSYSSPRPPDKSQSSPSEHKPGLVSGTETVMNGGSLPPPCKPQMQWGAPAVMTDSYFPAGVLVKRDDPIRNSDSFHSISESEIVSGLLNSAGSLHKPSGKAICQIASSRFRNNHQALNESIESRSDPLDYYRFSSEPERKNLNQSLPVSYHKANKCQEPTHVTVINKSYEANQSFPKMAKPLQAVSTEKQNTITDSNLTATPRIDHLGPRSRRSIFGISPPDMHQSHKVKNQESSTSSTLGRISNDPNELDYMGKLWSVLDVSGEIGQIPTLQEVLFNCVTSCICVVDPERNGKIISVNESFQFLIGLHERVIGQRLFRFVKVRAPLDSLGSSLPQEFILADGRQASLSGKLLSCIVTRGEEIPVSVWTVPYRSRPNLTLCIIGVVVPVTAEIYLNQKGSVLMYSEQFEDIHGLAGAKLRDSAQGVCQIPELDFSKMGIPQHISLHTLDGSTIPVSITVSVNTDSPCARTTTDGISDSTIFSATLSVSTNVAGLLTVQSDGLIKSCDQNFFRINLGHSKLERKYKLSELLSEIVKTGQSSAQSSHNSSPVSDNSGLDLAFNDVSQLLGGQTTEKDNRGGEEKDPDELYLPQSCFFMLRESVDKLDASPDHGEQSFDTDNEAEDVRLSSFTLHAQNCCHLVPHQTSTPCKEEVVKHPGLSYPAACSHAEQEKILMDNGIYSALFLHGNGSKILVTFKLSRIQTSKRKCLFCLWVYIQPKTAFPKESESDYNEEEEEEAGEEEYYEAEVTKQLQHLHFDQSLDRAVDPSLGQLIIDQAALNQSHNATGSDILDLEVAMEGAFCKKYIVREALGQGSFGFVRRAQVINSTTTVVVKFIKNSKMFEESWTVDAQNRRLPLEVVILKQIDCPYIIKLFDVHENSTFIQMVMEDFGNTDLFDFIDQVEIDEPLACFMFRQILWAVEYLHNHGIVHLDIKDENVIVNQSFQCKLIDFGSASYMLPEGNYFYKFRGTLEYCSPEIYNLVRYQGPELDMWALGVTLFTIVFRENPFTASEIPCQLSVIDLPGPVSNDLVSLLMGLLTADPKKRCKMQTALSSPWLQQIVDMEQYKWEEMFGDGQQESLSDADAAFY